MAQKKKKGNAPKAVKAPKPKMLFYYYMLKEQVQVQELADCAGLAEEKTEIWKEMNCIELLLANDSLVLEDAAEDFENSEDQEFLEKKGIAQIYAVTFSELDEQDALAILKKMVHDKGGIICSDTEDFNPILMGSFE